MEKNNFNFLLAKFHSYFGLLSVNIPSTEQAYGHSRNLSS